MRYWKLKVVGDQMLYTKASGDTMSHAVIHITNSRWPGTNCVWKDGAFCNIYIGFGYKNTGESYYPTQLGVVDKDPEDTREHPEPNPEKEPVIPEDDTDEEKQEGEGEEGEQQQ